MDRPEPFVIRIFVASLVLVASATLAGADPGVNTDRSTATQPTPTLAVPHVRVPLPGLREEAAMVLVGTALIGLAAAVRRSA
jgi:hypothetical protein